MGPGTLEQGRTFVFSLQYESLYIYMSHLYLPWPFLFCKFKLAYDSCLSLYVCFSIAEFAIKLSSYFQGLFFPSLEGHLFENSFNFLLYTLCIRSYIFIFTSQCR